MSYKAEYIWIDGTEPTAQLRSKMRVLPDGATPPVWGFDGSSTNQAPGKASDCVLLPVRVVPDPVRGGGNALVLCEVLLIDMSPHPSNTRALLREVAERYEDQEPIFGIEQEYTLFKDGRPLGFPEGGYPGPQGPYYCSVGAGVAFGRAISEEHATACMEAGLAICGTNAEVMPGQWEFQIGPVGPLEVSDHLWLARWLAYRIAEEHGVVFSIDPKPIAGDWNGAGAHTNFSTVDTRASYDAVIAVCEALATRPIEHVKAYGDGIEERLTGLHETAPWNEFSYGVSDRGASVRIPWQVALEGRGYIEDRRPNANMDPYVVTRMMVETCCEALADKAGKEMVA
ncbi:MAG: glutamine synthetase beta-grasp domain-containing protein [Candidatus Dormibacteraeota bacterium]|nr:glutamine synthetase beta-grasp domain-containing protein [Candidatus Dormibacteraeota bacterium]